VLQCVAVCCSVLQCVAVEYVVASDIYEFVQHMCAELCCIAIQCVAVCCSVLQLRMLWHLIYTSLCNICVLNCVAL